MAQGLAREEAMAADAQPHRPVLLSEMIELLQPVTGAVIVDATVGPAGHAEALLRASAPEGRVIGIDRDPAALEHARRRLAGYGNRFEAVHGDHRDLVALLRERGVFVVDGIVADLGISSLQLGDAGRGFAFSLEGPLDMRMDPTAGSNAADLLATLDESEIRHILATWGEERRAGAIAREIVRQRRRTPLRTTRDLADLVERVAGARARRYRIHPATRTFQALRIAVNREIEGLDAMVTDATSMLRRGGRLVVISFHSLEDRAVKRGLRALAHRCICPPNLPVCGCGRENLVRILTSKPIRPTDDEVRANPRARSARLRAAERL